ncbi:hypothetical protein BC332_25488 [Capsicum chinense]|nr:hypothetical protein BC332_25488 [Capsicum chinense]
MVGWLKNTELAVDAISTSVHVSNELGAGRPKAVKFSVVVAVITSTLIGVVFAVAVIATKNHYPRLFSGKPEVIHETSKLAYFLAAAIFLMRIQPILHGNLDWNALWAIHAEERIRTYDDQSSQDEIEQFVLRTTSPLPVVT